MARSFSGFVFGACAAAVLVGVVARAQSEQHVTPRPVVGASAGLFTHLVSRADRPTQLILVDPERLVVSVHHIAAESGEIQLKSVREIQWDLELSEFNTVDPLPEHIRNMVQRQ